MDKYDLQHRYLTLTRIVLPSLALERRWAVRHGGAFMRIVLDHVCGGAWERFLDTRLRAYKQLTPAQLRWAVRLAELMAEEGEPLVLAMNGRSLAWRGGIAVIRRRNRVWRRRVRRRVAGCR